MSGADELHLLGFGAALGERRPVAAPHVDDGHISLSVADSAGIDLAVAAARRTMRAAALTDETGGWLRPVPPQLHLHSSIWREPIEFWSSSSYVLAQLGAGQGRGSSGSMSAMSGSALLGISWLAGMLAGRPQIPSGLWTGGDAYGAPAMDRYTDRGILYGDGGSAAIVGRRPGLAKLRAIAEQRCPPLEALHRGRSWSSVRNTDRPAVDLRARKRDFLASGVTVEEIDRANERGLTDAASEALGAAGGYAPADARWVIGPWYGDALLQRHVLDPLGIERGHTTAALGAHLGHLGPHDQLVSLAHLWAHRLVEPGDLLLVLAIGVGMTWTAALLEVEAVPEGMAELLPPEIADLAPLASARTAAA